MRHYASAGTSYGCLSVSVTSRSSIEMAEQIWLVFGMGTFSTYPTTGYKEIQVPSKIRVLPSRTLLQTLDLENFATAYRPSKCVINLAGERWTLRA